MVNNMNFEEFKSRVVSVFRKKVEDPLSFSEEIEEMFKKDGYTVESFTVTGDDSFKARVSRIDWVSNSDERLPRVRRNVVGKVMGYDLVLFVDETMGENRYNYFEIYDRKYNVTDKIWLGDFLTGLDNRYLMNIIRTFENDLPTSFIWKINEEAKAKKKKLFLHKSVDKQG